MNFSFLPSKIKKELEAVIADKVPVSIARSNASVEGKPGEGYVVAYDDKIFVFSRELGDSNYTQLSAELGNVAKVGVNKDGINTFLDIDLGGKQYSMKFSSFEEKNLKLIVDNWISKSGSQSTTASPEPEIVAIPTSGGETDCNPTVGLASSMMYIASVDDDISKEEDYYIIAMMGNNKQILQDALTYYKSHTFQQLIADLNDLDNEQKLCFLANMMEVGMKDGVLHTSEMNLMRVFSNAMNITDDQYDTIKQVLLIKN
jgi:uncharacterized tellurite resistance protein B-like protein